MMSNNGEKKPIFSFAACWPFKAIKSSFFQSLFSVLPAIRQQLHFTLASIKMSVLNCYWGPWAAYREGNGQFTVDDINPFLCTHLTYCFFGIDNTGTMISLNTRLDEENIKKAIKLKNVNPNLKVIASVGGESEEATKNFSKMARDSIKREEFIRTSLKFLRENGFDGLDLDWEFPGHEDKENFVTLVRELCNEFAGTGLELSIAVGPLKETADTAYNIHELSKYVNYINLMTYNYSGDWNGVTGPNTPLYGNNGLNIASSVEYWVNAGAPVSKLVLGIAFYGRCFTLADRNQDEPGSRAKIGKAGPYTKSPGTLGYNEICENLDEWSTNWDDRAMVPYAVKGDQWVSYDNVDSIQIKIDYLKSKGLAGALVWSLEMDDFRGDSGEPFQLLKAINKFLDPSIDPSETDCEDLSQPNLRNDSINWWYAGAIIVIAAVVIFGIQFTSYGCYRM